MRSNPLPCPTASVGSRQNQLILHRNVRVDDNSESDNGDEDEEEDEDEDEEDDGDDWSGQDDDLEARLVEALGHDLPLAAYLIPHLYRVFHSEVSTNITQKVDPWRNSVRKCATDIDTTSSSKTTSSSTAANTSNSSNTDPRKRQRGLGAASHDQDPEDEDEEDEDDEDDKRGPKRLKDHPESGVVAQHPRLACHFYKLDPSKYGVHHETVENGKKPDYRVCAGPGFKNITRLK